jgi:transcriptional regulator with XRE-family HTH domain
MGIASEDPSLLSPPPEITAAESSLTSNPAIEPLQAREVLRCQHCSLVQFRTASDLCRRCSKALPSRFPVLVEEPACAEDGEMSEAEMEMELGTTMERGERNRKVSVGARLKLIRRQRELTQVEMSALLGIPRSYLSRIENNRLLPGPLMVQKFSTALEIDISELLPHGAGKDRVEDPVSALVLRQFNQLTQQQQGEVLVRVRMMLRLPVSLRPAGAESAIPPAAQEAAPSLERKAPGHYSAPLPVPTTTAAASGQTARPAMSPAMTRVPARAR